MKTLYVLIMLSGSPGPTWTVSEPVEYDTCIAMQQAVEDFADSQNGDSIFNSKYTLPQLMVCREVQVK